MTHYELLGVAPNADTATIRRAYRSIAKTCHPDVCKDGKAEERFKKLGEAHAILTDERLRYFYDASLMPIPPQKRGSGDSLFGFSGSVSVSGVYGVEVKFSWD